MALFGIRFDLRNPAWAGTDMADRYAAALDMAAWADDAGAYLVVLSEHHGVDDGYLPSALTMAAAVAARTTKVRILISAVVSSFHDPIRLAEDAAVVDLISRGRLDLVVTNGYVPSEFEMFGRSLSERPRRTTEAVRVLKAAWTGEPFDVDGRTVRVTPRPHQPNGPSITLGGSSEAAARRAARIADGFQPSTDAVWEFYREERIALGKPDPGPPLGADSGFLHVADDVDAAWRVIAPHARHDADSYATWAAAGGVPTAPGITVGMSDEALRSCGRYRVVTPDELVAELADAGPFAFTMLHPLMGGLPPAVGWDGLRRFAAEVLPKVA